MSDKEEHRRINSFTLSREELEKQMNIRKVHSFTAECVPCNRMHYWNFDSYVEAEKKRIELVRNQPPPTQKWYELGRSGPGIIMSGIMIHHEVVGPTRVVLCGSTKFYKAFQEANFLETRAGKIVLSIGFYPRVQEDQHGGDVGISPEEKLAADELYKRKIDWATEVLVLNVGGYIGQSTRSEIEYATHLEKPIRYLEPL